MKTYIVSYGDSDKYAVNFPGSKDEFLNSDVMEHIRRSVSDFLKKEFPTGGYNYVAELDVEEGDAQGFEVLDDKTLPSLLHSVKRQVQVFREGKELNSNAPYDN